MRVFFKTMLALQLVYLLLTFFIPLPAWKMFSTMERNTFKIEDSQGHQIDYANFLPATMYSLREERLLSFTSFVCKKIDSDVIILKAEIKNKNERYHFKKPFCKPEKN